MAAVTQAEEVLEDVQAEAVSDIQADAQAVLEADVQAVLEADTQAVIMEADIMEDRHLLHHHTEDTMEDRHLLHQGDIIAQEEALQV